MTLKELEFDEETKRLMFVASRVHRESILVSELLPEERIIDNLCDLEKICGFLRMFDSKIVLTMGTFDLLHVGHARYIRQARKRGSILVVGLDDDAKARGRKGENRPAVPYVERSELLTYLRFADIIARKSNEDEKWAMIKAVRPHTLIAVVGTYSPDEEKALKEFCENVVVLDRQAETSTSNQIRKMILDGADNFSRILKDRIPKFVAEVYEEMKK